MRVNSSKEGYTFLDWPIYLSKDSYFSNMENSKIASSRIDGNNIQAELYNATRKVCSLLKDYEKSCAKLFGLEQVDFTRIQDSISPEVVG